jgi:putative copper resistance protein D
LGLVVQTGLLAGSFDEGLRLSNLQAAIGQMNFGRSAVVRAVISAMVLFSLSILPPSRLVWLLAATGGTAVCASLAWMGHGAATEGTAGIVHLFADIAHAVAAAVWIGALAGFVFLLRNRPTPGMDNTLCQSLHRFSGVGSCAVALLVATGVVNSWFLIGLDGLWDAWTTPYGKVLIAKLMAFAGMLVLAALNRYRLTPAFADALNRRSSPIEALSMLKRSLLFETSGAIVVLALVAWLGTLAPVIAQ